MSEFGLVALVEGHGEEIAVPSLIRRLCPHIRDVRAWRHTQGRLLAPGGLERAIDAIAIKHPRYSIVVLIDSEDTAPCQLGPELIARVTFRPDLRVRVTLAYREFETWFCREGCLTFRLIRIPNPFGMRRNG